MPPQPWLLRYSSLARSSVSWPGAALCFVRLGPGPLGDQLPAHEREDGRCQGQGDDDGDGHCSGGREAHDGQERQARDDEGREGDDDGQAGEEHGVAGGAGGQRHGLLGVHSGEQLAAVPVDDEQGVVDADGEAQHQGEHRGDGTHVHGPAQGERGADADGDADECHQQREAGGDQGAEHDDEHQGCHRDADDLGGAEELGDVLADFLAGQRCHIGSGHLADDVLDLLADLGRQSVDRRLELDLRDRGLAVLGDEAEALGGLQLARAQGQLGLAGFQFRGTGVELCLTFGEGRLLLAEPCLDRGRRHAGGRHLLLGGFQLGLSGGELGGGRLQPGLAGSGLLLAGGEVRGGLVELRLGGERVHRALDVRKGLELGQRGGHSVLARLAELGAVGFEDNAGGTTRRRGELLLEFVCHLLGFGSRDLEVVGQRAVEGGCRAAHRHHHCEPQRDDEPAVAVRELAEAVEQ